MHRILTTVALLALAPACVHAQAAATKATGAADAPRSTPAARRSHNAFGEAILELTRAARAQAAAAAETAETADATPVKKAASPAKADTKAVPAASLPADAPVLADSNRS